MKLEQLNHSPSGFVREYIKFSGALRHFFDYTLSDDDEQARFDELEKYTYQRQALCDALLHFQQGNNLEDAEAIMNIERLRSDRATVVIGGQQAGIFGGPLYTVHKMLSILLEAKRLEEKYDRPVIPVFWIAGEDHDEDEINHTYVYDDRQRKCKLKNSSPLKLPASEQHISKKDVQHVLTALLEVDHESFRTRELIDEIDHLLEDVETYSTFFWKWFQNLFEGTGLVFMDAHDPEIRSLEKEYFADLIHCNAEIRKAFRNTASALKQAGYGEPIETFDQNSHLFVHDINGERQLLSAVGENQFADPASGCHWTKEELIAELRQGRLKLSNNVVTRPLMQDLLFPVHTFIGGAGEIRYWGTLKEAFSVLGHQMPLVRPRLHFTIVDRKSEKELKRYELQIEEVIRDGVAHKIDELSKRNVRVNDKEVLTDFENNLKQAIDQLKQSYSGEPGHYEQAGLHLEKELIKKFEEHSKEIRRLRALDQSQHITRLSDVEGRLAPGGQLQERTYSIVSLLHTYDTKFVNLLYDLLGAYPKKFDGGEHIALYL
ncbi:bacillithiol biosynthesis cysteine-adding enzyme BshC [Salisediminibacterium beveridgei]|uniref:Putative cysteine ligase BshC n=1 Tax=Salisediminibacterium beveridgei TaxID=632773 RepID=A0A1D7QW93_9BACI|nr:bacillithiol biosynthesis cysteine-adding enzyme BshC [Salisediminibacterium beveridgei]AOM83283.1 hypothetical protein BBEV_1922 [Salisediminibacterium beveridgei]